MKTRTTLATACTLALVALIWASMTSDPRTACLDHNTADACAAWLDEREKEPRL